MFFWFGVGMTIWVIGTWINRPKQPQAKGGKSYHRHHHIRRFR